MNKKVIALLMVCVLALGCAIGGTMAWLVDSTGNVKNTFTVGDINIGLTETGTDTDGNKNYDFVPGDTLSKDPKVTVNANSEDCYLFVKVVVENNACTVEDANGDEVTVNPIIDWAIAEGWKYFDLDTKAEATGTHPTGNGTYYFYRTVTKDDKDQSFYVLSDKSVDQSYNSGSVKVSDDVTKAMVSTINATDDTKPTLTFTAAAVQKAHIDTVDDAWEQLPTTFKPATSGT